MQITHVERYTIPIESAFLSVSQDNRGGTKVRDLSAALDKLPNGGIVSIDMNGNNIYVTWYNDGIEA